MCYACSQGVVRKGRQASQHQTCASAASPGRTCTPEDGLVGLGGSETAMLVMVRSGSRPERPARQAVADRTVNIRLARTALLWTLKRGVHALK